MLLNMYEIMTDTTKMRFLNVVCVPELMSITLLDNKLYTVLCICNLFFSEHEYTTETIVTSVMHIIRCCCASLRSCEHHYSE